MTLPGFQSHYTTKAGEPMIVRYIRSDMVGHFGVEKPGWYWRPAASKIFQGPWSTKVICLQRAKAICVGLRPLR